jgi:hypothetical protein
VRTGVDKYLLGIVLILFCVNSVFAQRELVDEYYLKAVFLERFTRFVTFTEEEASVQDNFYISMYGENEPLREYLISVYEKQLIQNKPVIIHVVSKISEIKPYGILIVCRDKEHDLDKIGKTFAGKGILIVGDTPGFASKGVVINMIIQGRKMRYEINPRTAEAYAIEIDRLLLSNAILIDSSEE